MCTDERGQYSAAASTLGYFYQCRYALLAALSRLSEGNRIRMGIETLDDVVFETDGSPLEVFQTKHHINAQASLADASPDLWKTLRIWIDGRCDGSIPADAQLFLITTAQCGDGSAASYLQPTGRDEPKALERLSATASTSTNESNRRAYQAFSALAPDDRAHLLNSITILDASPAINELDEKLRQAVFFAVERQFLDSYLQRLEGWWYRRVLAHLLDDKANPILGEELEAEASRIRAQFKEDNLPIDVDILQATVNASGYRDRAFVEQLKLIEVNQNRILRAIKNYYRAFEQRSRWMREDLLYVGELDRYDDRLIEEWDILFQQMCDALGDESVEEVKIRAAHELYSWVESGTHSMIRPGVNEHAIARGTYQILADDLRVGWHLEFHERLQSLLTSVEIGR